MNNQFFKILLQDFEVDEVQKREHSVTVRLLCLIAAVFCFVTIIINLITGNKIVTYCNIFGCFAGTLGAFLIYRGKRAGISEYILLNTFTLVFLFYILTGQNQGVDALWLLIIPFGVMYAIKPKRSIPYLSFISLFLLVVFYSPLRKYIEGYYSPTFMAVYPMVYLVDLSVSVMAIQDIVVNRRHKAEVRSKMRLAVEKERERASHVTFDTIAMISSTIDAKDEYTSEHSERVAECAVLIAEQMGFAADEVSRIREMALLHDIGKVGVPDKVLNKPGKLSNEEFAVIKNHTVIGASILHALKVIPYAECGAKYHHERYDGKGYPQGIAGEDIPIEARIICLADAFDAMNSKRVYRERCDMSYILEEIRKGRGTQFDPKVADAFLSAFGAE